MGLCTLPLPILFRLHLGTFRITVALTRIPVYLWLVLFLSLFILRYEQCPICTITQSFFVSWML